MRSRQSYGAILEGAEERYVKDEAHVYYLELVIRALIQKFAPMKVLDVGCGEGRVCSIFRRKGVQAYGIDRFGWRFMKEINGVLAVADAGNLPFKEECFDLVIAHQVIEHLENPEQFILEASRVLKRGGILFIVTTISPIGSTKLYHILRLKSIDMINLHNRSFWINTFEKYGFQLIGNFDKLLQKNPPFIFLGRILLKFGPVGRKLWARMVIIIRGSFLFKLGD